MAVGKSYGLKSVTLPRLGDCLNVLQVRWELSKLNYTEKVSDAFGVEINKNKTKGRKNEWKYF